MVGVDSERWLSGEQEMGKWRAREGGVQSERWWSGEREMVGVESESWE